MNSITKYNLKTASVSAVALVLLYSALSLLISPQNEAFTFGSINPLVCLEGVVFALGFGLGFSVWMSVMVIGLFSLALFVLFWWIARKVIK